jgi:hypothetical protein
MPPDDCWSSVWHVLSPCWRLDFRACAKIYGKFVYCFRKGHNFLLCFGISVDSEVILGQAVAQLVEALRRKVAVSIPDGFIGISH